MWWVIRLAILLLGCEFSSGKDNLNYSPFNCGSLTWEIDMTDSVQASKWFMDWLLLWQFDCDAHRPNFPKSAHNGGLGSSYMFASKYFMEGIEFKDVFRPLHGNDPWLWADPNPNNCSLHIRSYDCFTEPISDCGIPNAPPRDPSLVKELDRIRASMPENPLCDIVTKLMDVCTFAKILRKPVKWVHGHLLMYLTRPRPDAKAAIHHRKREIFSKLPRVVGNRTAVTVGMQVRAGPLNDDRSALNNLTEIVSLIDHAVRDIERRRPDHKVAMFFLCSDLPEMTYKSAEYMNKNYPRAFTFRTAHHVSLGSGDAEEFLRKNPATALPATKFDLFVDFMTDSEVLSNVDYVIGSKSNVYMVTAGYRMARFQPYYRDYPQNTCYVDKFHHMRELTLACEGTAEHKGTWAYYFAPAYTQFETIYPL